MSKDANALAEISTASGVDVAALAGVETDNESDLSVNQDVADLPSLSWLAEIDSDDRMQAKYAVSLRRDIAQAIEKAEAIDDPMLRDLVRDIVLLRIGDQTPLADREVAEELILDAVDRTSNREYAAAIVAPYDFVFYNKTILLDHIEVARKSGGSKPEVPRDLLRIATFEELTQETKTPDPEQLDDAQNDLGVAGEIISNLWRSRKPKEDGHKYIYFKEFTRARQAAQNIVHTELRKATIEIIARLESNYSLGESNLQPMLILTAVSECISEGDYDTADELASLMYNSGTISEGNVRAEIERKRSNNDRTEIAVKDVKW